MKISDVTIDYICEHLRDDPDNLQRELVEGDMDAAKQYILSYTGLTVEEIDDLPDMTTAYLVLIQDMYDRRSMDSDGKSANLTVASILNMHTRNLI